MKSKKMDLKAGVYVKNGKCRTLLATVGQKCIYAFGLLTDGCPAVTTCSATTFANTVGETPVKTLGRDEIVHLIEHMRSFRSRRHCNMWERNVFFTLEGKRDLQNAVGKRAQDPLLVEPAMRPSSKKILPGLLTPVFGFFKLCKAALFA